MLNAVTALALIGAVATAALWVRSYWAWDIAVHQQGAGGVISQRVVWSVRGRLYLISFGRDNPFVGLHEWRWDRHPADELLLRSSLGHDPGLARSCLSTSVTPPPVR